MLADQIRQFPSTPLGQETLIPSLRLGYEEMGRRLAVAQRFVLRRDALMMVQNVSLSSPSRFLTALGVCRLPYPTMWVEFAYKDRLDWLLQQKAEKGMIIVDHAEASPPSTLGFLMEQVDSDGRMIVMTPAWLHIRNGQEQVNVCNMSLLINTEPDVAPPTPEEAAVIREHHRKGEFGSAWVEDPKESDAAVRLEGRITNIVPDFLRPMWAELRLIGGAPALKQITDLALYDLRSEWRFALSLLTLLNSRNVVDYGPPNDLTKLNKAREKKGKPPLLDTRMIRLSLSKVQKRRAGGMGAGDSRDLQAHLVAGHWKLRKTGLFWWTPHVRGSVGTVPDARTYQVVA